MPEWPGFGVDGILAVQAASGALATQLWGALTFLGSEWFYLLVMPALLWCVDAGLGMRMGIVLLTSGSLNAALKLAFGLPRPFWVDSRVGALSFESSFGMPSGHAQNAVALWGYLAAALRRGWAWAAAGLLVSGISFSRLALGVHFAADLVVGWAIGAFVLLLMLRFQGSIAGWMKSQLLRTRLLAAGMAALALLVVGGLVRAPAAARPVPAEWVENYMAASGAEGTFAAADADGVIASTGALFGLAIGAVLLDHWGRFDGRGSTARRGLRFLVGVAGVLVLFVGLGTVFPESDVFRYLRYAIVGFWIAYGAPRTFARLGIG